MSVFTQGGDPLLKLDVIFKDRKPSSQPASVTPVFHGGGQRMLSAPPSRDDSADRRSGAQDKAARPDNFVGGVAPYAVDPGNALRLWNLTTKLLT